VKVKAVIRSPDCCAGGGSVRTGRRSGSVRVWGEEGVSQAQVQAANQPRRFRSSGHCFYGSRLDAASGWRAAATAPGIALYLVSAARASA